MLTVNIHEAKTHLSRLLDRAAKGEPFIITKAASRWSRSCRWTGQVRRLGFVIGQIAVPNDFDRMGDAEIEQLFGCHW